MEVDFLFLKCPIISSRLLVKHGTGIGFNLEQNIFAKTLCRRCNVNYLQSLKGPGTSFKLHCKSQGMLKYSEQQCNNFDILWKFCLYINKGYEAIPVASSRQIWKTSLPSQIQISKVFGNRKKQITLEPSDVFSSSKKLVIILKGLSNEKNL